MGETARIIDPQARLAVLLATTGLTQLDLARLLRVDGRTVRRWMQGVSPPPAVAIEQLEALAHTLDEIGVLNSTSRADRAHLLTAFQQGVRETGYVEGQNVAIEYRWAQDQYDRLPDLAADLVRRHVAVITAHDTPSAIAAKAATTTIPIVFASGGDLVELGLVGSLNRLGGNVTGVTFLDATLGAKQLAPSTGSSPGLSWDVRR
jgi:transcriptional regulator with XRE-family HTH domain